MSQSVMTSFDAQDALFQAAAANDSGAVRKALMMGAHLDAEDHMERTAMHIASQHGHTAVMRTLLSFKHTQRLIDAGLLEPMIGQHASDAQDITQSA